MFDKLVIYVHYMYIEYVFVRLYIVCVKSLFNERTHSVLGYKLHNCYLVRKLRTLNLNLLKSPEKNVISVHIEYFNIFIIASIS